MWGRVSAGALAGFFLSAALIGLICWSLPGPWQQTTVPGLIAFLPLWTGVFCISLLFANGKRAWLWLGGLGLCGMGLLWTLQALGWVR